MEVEMIRVFLRRWYVLIGIYAPVPYFRSSYESEEEKLMIHILRFCGVD